MWENKLTFYLRSQTKIKPPHEILNDQFENEESMSDWLENLDMHKIINLNSKLTSNKSE